MDEKEKKHKEFLWRARGGKGPCPFSSSEEGEEEISEFTGIVNPKFIIIIPNNR